jgi:hypothetical protein
MPRFETEVGIPVRNPKYTPDGTHGEQFPPSEAKFGFWLQAMSMTWNYLAECGDIKNGWLCSNLVWVEQPREYFLGDPLVVETPGFRFVSHSNFKSEDEQIITETLNDGNSANGFTGFTGNAEPVLFNQQPVSLSDGGFQIPNSSVVFKSPA